MFVTDSLNVINAESSERNKVLVSLNDEILVMAPSFETVFQRAEQNKCVQRIFHVFLPEIEMIVRLSCDKSIGFI
jgi:hypothetical protein